MKDFTNKDLSEQELWDFCNEEYESKNVVVRFLQKNFFNAIFKSIASWDENASVLEVGCGAGASSRIIQPMLNKRSFEVSEYDERFVRRLKRLNLPYAVSQESVYDLKRAENSFDHIIMLEVLEHLDDPRKALNELFRVTKKSVLISVPHEPIWCAANFMRGKYITRLGNTPGHINHWGILGLTKLLSNYGEVNSVRAPFPWIVVEVMK